MTERLALFERRPLSRGEMLIARFMFADEVDASRVRVIQAPKLGFAAMVPLGETIVFSLWRAARDFACAPLSERGHFVHELAHVWQARRGVVLAAAKLGALGLGAYDYVYRPDKPFHAYNIEQQAEIARHLFLARNGAPEPGAPPIQALEAIWPVQA